MEAHIPVCHQESCSESHKWHKPIGMPEPQMGRACPNFSLIAGDVSDGLEPKFILTGFICR